MSTFIVVLNIGCFLWTQGLSYD